VIFSYQQDHFPSFPALEVTFISEQLSLSVGPVSALIDTGTDVTTVPTHLLEQTQAPFSRSTFVRPHWGERQSVYLYLVDARVGEWKFPALEVIADDHADEILIGRDLLNKLWIALDGRNQKTEILERAPQRRGR
jgi:predicted aspartyl protease